MRYLAYLLSPTPRIPFEFCSFGFAAHDSSGKDFLFLQFSCTTLKSILLLIVSFSNFLSNSYISNKIFLEQRMARSQTFPRYAPPTPPAPGALSRTTTTYSITQRSTFSASDPSQTLPTGSTSFAYHTPIAPIPTAFEPIFKTAPATVQRAAETVAATEETKPDKSKRFLSTKLYFSGSSCDGKNTIFTFASTNRTWGTVFNSLTLGLSAPLCRVYFVEILFEDQQIVGQESVESFLEKNLGFSKMGAPVTGENIVRWLEYQELNELRGFGFEKLQGNSFAVYLLTIPVLGGSIPDTIPLRKRAERRYKVSCPTSSILTHLLVAFLTLAVISGSRWSR